MTKKPRAEHPLTDNEIVGAIQKSGFPLELRLYEALHVAGLDPTVGMRFAPGDGESSVEVDLIARAGASLTVPGMVYLWALIEAKQLNERTAFVGLRARQPSVHEMRAMRLRLSGLPTCRVLPTPSERISRTEQQMVQLLLAGSPPPAAALDALNDAVVCPHWCYVRDNEKHHYIEASKEERARESFAKLVRVTTWLEQHHATSSIKPHVGSLVPELKIMSPTIVLGTPHLYIYDPIAKTLEKTERLTLQEMHEVGDGVVHRYIDVVTEASLPSFVARYKRAVEDLRDACNPHTAEILEIAKEQTTSDAVARYRGLDKINAALRDRNSCRTI